MGIKEKYPSILAMKNEFRVNSVAWLSNSPGWKGKAILENVRCTPESTPGPINLWTGRQRNL